MKGIATSCSRRKNSFAPHPPRSTVAGTGDRLRRRRPARGGQVEGKIAAAKSQAGPERPAANDQALADRVNSEIFQPEDAARESVNVNVEQGVVYLRGEVDRQDQIRNLVERARSVEGVTGVESLLRAR